MNFCISRCIMILDYGTEVMAVGKDGKAKVREPKSKRHFYPPHRR